MHGDFIAGLIILLQRILLQDIGQLLLYIVWKMLRNGSNDDFNKELP